MLLFCILFVSVGLDRPAPNHHLIRFESQTITPSIVRPPASALNRSRVRAPKHPNAHGAKAAAAARWHLPVKEKHIAGYKFLFFRILGFPLPLPFTVPVIISGHHRKPLSPRLASVEVRTTVTRTQFFKSSATKSPLVGSQLLVSFFGFAGQCNNPL